MQSCSWQRSKEKQLKTRSLRSKAGCRNQDQVASIQFSLNQFGSVQRFLWNLCRLGFLLAKPPGQVWISATSGWLPAWFRCRASFRSFLESCPCVGLVLPPQVLGLLHQPLGAAALEAIGAWRPTSSTCAVRSSSSTARSCIRRRCSDRRADVSLLGGFGCVKVCIHTKPLRRGRLASFWLGCLLFWVKMRHLSFQFLRGLQLHCSPIPHCLRFPERVTKPLFDLSAKEGFPFMALVTGGGMMALENKP